MPPCSTMDTRAYYKALYGSRHGYSKIPSPTHRPLEASAQCNRQGSVSAYCCNPLRRCVSVGAKCFGGAIVCRWGLAVVEASGGKFISRQPGNAGVSLRTGTTLPVVQLSKPDDGSGLERSRDDLRSATVHRAYTRGESGWESNRSTFSAASDGFIAAD